MRRLAFALLLLFAFFSQPLHATIFSSVHGVVHDPQHRPIAGAHIILRAAHSDLSFSADSDSEGAFALPAVPFGDYIATIHSSGFADLKQTVTVAAGSSATLHFQLAIAAVNSSVAVHAAAQSANVDSVTPTTLLDRTDIALTPGADRTNSLAMITDYVPGAYMTHDMLHMRGGHELSWLIDGVFIPGTNIASNVGPQIDPKDIDSLEVDRGSYDASLGDRTYGIFNVVPRTGFERDREAELVLTAGNFLQTNDQISLGDHTQRFAWYASLNGNRSDYGLQPATEQPVHDAENGYGGFTSLVYNHDPANQLRLVSQLRTDYYQIPNDPDPNDWENQLYDSSGLFDGEHETDSYAALTWLHTFSAKTTSQISPFYHFNRAGYQSNPDDQPSSTTADETGNYAGLQASVSTVIARNSLSAGIYGYAQHENDLFGAVFNDNSYTPVNTNPVITAGVQETFVEDNFKPVQWVTVIAGLRQSHFSGAITEDAVYPRLGLAVMIPKLGWVLRGFYGHFYQPPPLTTLSGSLLSYAQTNGIGYLPLKGERNEEHQFGLQIPFHGWLLDADTFQTQAQNFLDHEEHRRVQRLLSPSPWPGRAGAGVGAHPPLVRISGAFGQAPPLLLQPDRPAVGPITGGAVCVGASQSPGDPSATSRPGYSALRPRPAQHPQRRIRRLPPLRRFIASFNIYYGSGFSNGYTIRRRPYSGPVLPAHTTADLTLGRSFGKQTNTVSVTALNITNTPRAARQQPHLRRLPLQRPPPDLRRTPLPLPLLTRAPPLFDNQPSPSAPASGQTSGCGCGPSSTCNPRCRSSVPHLKGDPMYIAVAMLLATAAAPLTPQQAATVRSCEHKLMAPCCYSQTIDVHMSDVAETMREEVTQMAAAGESEQQILDHYKSIYGEQILVVPDGVAGQFAFNTPVAVFLVSCAALFFLLRKFRRAAPPPAVPLPMQRSAAEWQQLRDKIHSEIGDDY